MSAGVWRAAAHWKANGGARLVYVAQALHELGVGTLLAHHLVLVQLYEVHRDGVLWWPRRGSRKGLGHEGRFTDVRKRASKPAPIEEVVHAHPIRLAL